MNKLPFLIALLFALFSTTYGQETVKLDIKVWGYEQAFLPEGSHEFSSRMDSYQGWHRRALFGIFANGIPSLFVSIYTNGLYFNEAFPLDQLLDKPPSKVVGKGIANPATLPPEFRSPVRTSRFWRKRNLNQKISTFRLQVKLEARSLGEFEVKVLNPTAKCLKYAWKVEKMEVFQILEVYEAKFISDP